VVRRLNLTFSAATAVAASALAVAVTATAGYGPTVPPGSSVPGGFSTVIASKTFGPGGGTLGAAAGKSRFILRVERGALTRRIQLTLTRPRLGSLKTRVPHGTVPVTGVAVLATYPNGRFVPGTFGSNRLRLTVVDRGITKRSIVLVWDQGQRRFARYRATITAGHATFVVSRIHEFVIASPS
jgi:hypothetical protein